jgi:uncharacterized protein
MERAMVDIRPPGVFVERTQSRPASLQLLPSGVPCFLGLTERGPTNEPVRVTSLREFHEVFGSLDIGGYTEPAIDGFFLNGGKECFIVRIAHLFERGRKEIATKASIRLRDAAKANTLMVSARAEGMWGNQVRVSVRFPPPKVQTFITIDAKEGDTTVMVKSTYGFARGTLVKIDDEVRAPSYRLLTRVDGRTLQWDHREPLERDFKSMAPTMIEPVGFDVIAETHNEREVFRQLNLERPSPWFAERIINGVSKLIEVTNLDSASVTPDNLPTPVENVGLEGGTDGVYTVTAEDFIGADLGPGNRYGLAGIAELDEMDLIVAPDLVWCFENSAGFKSVKDMEIVQQAIVSQCEDQKNRFAILDMPPDQNPRGAMQWRRLFHTSFAAFYYPYIIPVGQSQKAIPPSGHIAGVYARCDEEMGVYRAPANEIIEGVVDLDLFLQQSDIATLNKEGVNCSQVFPQRGIRVWGARTAYADPLLRHVNVRRTIAAITRSLNSGLQWVMFENNDTQLWSIIARDVSFFLDDLWQSGYLRGQTQDEAYYVRCDESLNTAGARDRGRLHVEVWLAPLRPAEFIGVRITQEVNVLAREDE